jgi:hypothetical protein
MALDRIACVCGGIVIASAAASAQQAATTTDPTPQSPISRVIERTYPAGVASPWRHVLTRSVSGDREVVTETVETPGMDGRPEPFQEIVTVSTRPALGSARTTTEMFAFGAQRERRLLERTESTEVVSGAETTVSRNTWAPDSSGRLALTSRHIETTRTLGPDGRDREATLLLSTINEALRESQRTQYAERQTNPAVIRQESSDLRRDVNGRWQPIETRSREIRDTGSSERVEEETIQRPNVSGNLVLSERSITRRSTASGREDVVIETYAQGYGEFTRSDSRFRLSQRVRRSSTATAGGGRSIIEEVEALNRVAPNDPPRVVKRTVATVRPIGPDRWTIERQVFERDPNGRLLPAIAETEETAGK